MVVSDSTSAPGGVATQTRILIVDDNQGVAKALSRLLTDANFATQVSFCGSDAIAYLEGHSIDGAVVDVHLPDMNGLVLTQAIRQKLGPDKPIIVLSGDTSMEVLNSLRHVGATYFFSKPVNATHLLERFKEWFGGSSGASH